MFKKFLCLAIIASLSFPSLCFADTLQSGEIKDSGTVKMKVVSKIGARSYLDNTETYQSLSYDKNGLITMNNSGDRKIAYYKNNKV